MLSLFRWLSIFRGCLFSQALSRASLAIAAISLFCTERALAQRPLGIDVSGYQGSYQSPPTHITWASIPSSIKFAWAKATEGTGGTDPDFSFNASGAKANGILLGAYHYAHPEANTPTSEASHFWAVAGSQIKADGLTLMPMLDIEGSALPNGHVGAASLSDWINIWITDVIQIAANNGVSIKPAIYVSACNACNFDTTVGQWFNDIADYNGQDAQTSTPWTTCTGCERWGAGGWNFWQYTSTGGYAGINGNVDHDVFNGTGAALTNTMIATATTNSTILYWDPQGTTGSTPYSNSMTGTWETAKWSYGSAGLATPVNWVDGKAACFGVHTGIGTPAYTVTMNSGHVVAGFFDGALTPKACDITIQGSGIINLASGAQALDANNASDGSLAKLRINVTIAGDGVLYPEGNGQSFLHGTNTFTGGTTLGYSTVPFKGTVSFNNGDAFGTGLITLWDKGNGGTLTLEGSNPVTVTNPVSVTAATTNNIVGNPAGLTFSGNWNLGALLTLGGGAVAGNQTIISGIVTGSSGLTVYNSGTIVLSGTNTYTGTTTINSPAVFTIGGDGQLGSGAHAGNIVINGTFNYGSSAAQTLSGTVSGAGPLRVNGGGNLVLTHANTFTGGTTVNSASTLCITADSALGGSAASVTLNNGCLKNNNSSPTVVSTRTITLGSGGGYLDAGWAPSSPLTLAAKLTGSGPLHINLDGSPVVLSNPANNYTGNTIIGTNGPGFYAAGSAALLKLGASGVIPNGAGLGNVIINGTWSGILDLAGFSQTINGLGGDGTITNSTAGTGSLSVGNNNQTSTFNGTILNTVGTLNLTKIGSGSLTLGGSNSYNGTTTISSGVLALGPNGWLGNNARIAIEAGATLDVSALGGFTLTSANSLTASGTVSPATIRGDSTVHLAGVPMTLNYDGSHPALTVLAGNFNLSSGSVTVNGAILPLGIYPLIQSTGSVSLVGPLTIGGSAIGAGRTAALAANGGTVNLVLTEPSAFSNLTPNSIVTYGSNSVTLSGRLSGSGPVYPASNETVVVTINGNSQLTAINDSTGDFSFDYNLSGIPASGSPYSITYAYAGNESSLDPATNSSTTITINSAVVYSQTNNIVSIVGNGDGTFTVNMLGTPQATYYLQACSDLTTWTPLPGSTNSTDNSGQWSFVVSNSAPAFYRSVAMDPVP